ncbi:MULTISPECIES: hypothetical protein [Xanthomonas]|uniref:hypothetical protein n=1 Tax=Xanthomonas TaxID=338 RepID=UPI0011C48C7D|nr:MULTISPECIES: hypothetical protein [Xanthomonas]CAD1796386.1 hypothetical protein XSP_003630 [Xanthomonas sp. CPBF 426]CAG2096076.1 hypothetical protein XCY_003589 [Xanthomonas euroxanthea]
MALLLIAVLSNPVLAAVADLHQAFLVSGDHLYSPSTQGSEGETSPIGDPQAGDLLDALMHASHCCGHLTAVTPAMLILHAMQVPAVQPQTIKTLAVSFPASSDIRPPIAL